MVSSLLKCAFFLMVVMAVDGNGCFHPGQRIHTIVTMSTRHEEGVFPVNTIASYICDPGYEILNNESRHCMMNGTWSGNEPYCGINVATTGHVQRILTSHEHFYNVNSQVILDGFYETCVPINSQINIQLNKTYVIDLLQLVFKVHELYAKNDIPNVYYTSTHDMGTIERPDFKKLELRKHYSIAIKDETYAVFQYPIDRPSLSKNVSLRIEWPEDGFALCDISTYTSSVIPEEWCRFENDINIKHFLYDDKCYVAFQEAYYTKWDEAKDSCEAYPGKQLSLAKFDKDPTKTYAGDSLADKSIDYWIINLNNVNKYPNCSSFKDFDTRAHELLCTLYKGRICEFEIPKCGSPDQRNGTLMVHDGQTATYDCHKHFQLVGDAVRHCSNGRWSSEAPTCKYVGSDSNEDICSVHNEELINYILDITIEMLLKDLNN